MLRDVRGLPFISSRLVCVSLCVHLSTSLSLCVGVCVLSVSGHKTLTHREQSSF